MSTQANELYVFGGGPPGLAAAYKIQRLAHDVGKNIKTVVISPEIHSCTKAGGHAVLGFDGFFMERHYPKSSKAILGLVRTAFNDLERTIGREGIECRFDRGYQLLGANRQQVMETVTALATLAGYTPSDFHVVKKDDRAALKGFSYAMETKAIGQVNVPELQQGLIHRIEHYGGEVRLGDSYTGHAKRNGSYFIETRAGGILSSQFRPVLSLGHQMKQVPGIRPVFAEYTAAIALQLSAEDFEKTTKGRPIAFCDTDIAGDVMWGGVDRKGVLALGFGGTQDPAKDRAKMEKAIIDRLEELRPGIVEKYRDQISYSIGAMAMTQNQYPIIGRFKDFDALTGFCSRGIVQSWAAADALAKRIVLNDNADLKLLREMTGRPRRPSKTHEKASESAPAA